MTLRSQLLTIQLPNDHGKLVNYFTYDGYLEEEDRHKIRQTRRDWERHAVSGTFVGLLAYVATRKLHLPTLHIRGYSIPTAGLFSGVVGAVLGYDLVNLYGNHASSSLEKEIILGAKHLPLWSNLRCAVNPDRAFFELADERHNEPLLFHSGLTPDAAARLIPDKVIGNAPHKPHAPTAGSHGHH